MSFRPVKSTSLATPHIEGAGVHLHRAFGFGDPTRLDPFLMFDDFRGDHPSDYRAGFPWHPHRGIETITYVLAGAVDHGDSLGNRGTLKGGDVQWMTAGSGILHQEMPKGNGQGQMHGFQLWANLPRELKMTAPRYQPPNKKRTFKVDTRRAAFAYVFEGAAKFEDSAPPRGVLTEKEYRGEELNIRDLSGNRTLIEFGKGDEVVVRAGDDGVRFLLISGAPIAEPVAWHGPIVMNTQEELQQAMRELRNGTFIKPAH